MNFLCYCIQRFGFRGGLYAGMWGYRTANVGKRLVATDF